MKLHKTSEVLHCILYSRTWKFTLLCSANFRSNSDNEVHLMLKKLLHDYDPRLRPNYFGPPVEIVVDATILSFTNLDAINMVRIYFIFTNF